MRRTLLAIFFLLTGVQLYAKQQEDCGQLLEKLPLTHFMNRTLHSQIPLNEQAANVKLVVSQGFKRDLSKGARIELGRKHLDDVGGFGFLYLKRQGQTLNVSITKIVGKLPSDSRPIFLGEMGAIRGLESRLNPFLKGIASAIADYIDANPDLTRVVIRAHGVINSKMVGWLKRVGFTQLDSFKRMGLLRMGSAELKDGVDMEFVFSVE